MAILIRVPALPKGAVKEGEPMRLGEHGSIAQDYRKGETLYEHVTRANGEIRIYRVEP